MAFDERERTEPVVLQLEQPIGMIERISEAHEGIGRRKRTSNAGSSTLTTLVKGDTQAQLAHISICDGGAHRKPVPKRSQADRPADSNVPPETKHRAGTERAG